jgi:catechol 2,3-dioxygenase
MIPARRFGHVVLAVRNMKKSSEFYAMTVGLKVAAYNEARGQCFMSFGDDHHTLGLFQRAAPDGVPPAPDQPGIVHIAFEMEDFPAVQAAHAELVGKGVEIERVVEHNVTRSIYFRDPDNNCVELFSNLHENGFEGMRTTRLYNAPLDIATGKTGEIEYF